MCLAARRDFLGQGLGIVGLGAALPHFLLRTALAGPTKPGDERIVVAILLTGGPDGLSLVPPYGDDQFYKKRPQLALPPSDVIKLNDQVGLHPRLRGFKEMMDQGRLATILGTGYPNFNLSHFTSRDFWESATSKDQTGKAGATGWLGRYVDYACSDNLDPTLNVAVGPGRLPLIVTGRSHPGIGFETPESFRFSGLPSPDGQLLYHRLNELSAVRSQGDLQFVAQTAINANAASTRLGEIAGKYTTPVEYPDTQFAQSLRTIAGLIGGGLPARAYYAAQGIAVFGGYDTHAEQLRRLDQLLDELDVTLTAFYRDLQRQGNGDRVLTFTFSEFGRRVEENFSGGTDHGLAQPMFVMGAGVKAGVHGRQPSLTDLDERGNLKMQVDFRGVYAAILERWLGVPSEPILKGKYEPVDCIA
jgi:uncharacterized protein (DUF1501 family)